MTNVPNPHHRDTRWARATTVAATCLSLLALAGCGGSAMSPAKVLAANRAVEGQVAGPAAATGDPAAAAAAPTAATPAAGAPTAPGAAGAPPAAGGAAAAPSAGAGAAAGAPTAGGAKKGTKGPQAAASSAAPAGSQAASCAGFQNQTGITGSTITLANISDISGPVPGLFASAQQATKAFVAYFNSSSTICGRKLAVDSLDSATDAGANQRATQTACQNDFAAVGSMSAFDSGGAATAQGCGLPEINSSPVTREINACSTCFGAQSTNASQFENAVPDFWLKNNAAAAKSAAFLYLNAGAAAQNAATQMNVEKQRGMNFVYSAGIDTSEFNYGPYVQAMKDKGVRWVQMLGSYQASARLAQAMQQAGFKPDVYQLDPTAYNPDYVKQAGSAAEGTYVFINFTPFEEAASNPEMQLYRAWLNQVSPGATPTFFGLYAWSAARLFTEQALALGGRLTRASLVQAVSKVQNWDDHGLHAPQNVGSKTVAPCWRFLQYTSGAWRPVGGTAYTCTGVTTVGN